MLFPLLVDLGTTSTCSSIRYETLRVMMRMICAVESEADLQTILDKVPLAVFISSLLSTGSLALGVTVSALQMVHLLLEKLPNVYVPQLESEGVFHEIEKLVISSTPSTEQATSTASTSNSQTSTGTVSARRQTGSHHGHYTRRAAAAAAAAAQSAGSSSGSQAMEVDGEASRAHRQHRDLHHHQQQHSQTASPQVISSSTVPAPSSYLGTFPFPLLKKARVMAPFKKTPLPAPMNCSWLVPRWRCPRFRR